MLLAAALLAACGGEGGFDAAERALIGTEAAGIMRVLTTDDRADSLLLRGVSAPVTAAMAASAECAVLRRRMLATVLDERNPGVGIAAPQVGVRRRMIAVQRFDRPGEPFRFYFNPEIVGRSARTLVGPEGCLSLPDRCEEVERSAGITVRYLDESFEPRTERIEGFTAVIFQHEIDHLDGRLFVDRAADGPVERRAGRRCDSGSGAYANVPSLR